jgi:hypothetical protein
LSPSTASVRRRASAVTSVGAEPIFDGVVVLLFPSHEAGWPTRSPSLRGLEGT